MTRIPFILLSTSDGSPLTGATPSVTISKDGAAFTAATNAPHEIGNGYYYVDLTTAETTVTNNVIIRATATGAQPTAVVWEPEQTVPTAADNAQAVWGAQDKIVTIDSTQAATMETATGFATPSDVTTAQEAIIAAMPDISGLSTFDPSTDDVTINNASVDAVQAGLSTFDPSTDAVTIDSAQAATLATAEAQAAQTAALDKLAASILHWAATASTLTLYNSAGAAIGVYDLTRDSSGNITAIEPHAEG